MPRASACGCAGTVPLARFCSFRAIMPKRSGRSMNAGACKTERSSKALRPIFCLSGSMIRSFQDYTQLLLP